MALPRPRPDVDIKGADNFKRPKRREARASKEMDASEKAERKQFYRFRRDVEQFGLKGLERSEAKALLNERWIALGGKKPRGKHIPKNIGTQIWKRQQELHDLNNQGYSISRYTKNRTNSKRKRQRRRT